MTRRAQIATVAVFVVALLVPLALLGLGVRPEMTDNRVETAAPDLGGDAALQLETYEQLTGFLTDRLPLRDHAIGAEADVKDLLSFPSTADGQAGAGSEERWLNLDATLVDTCEGPPPSTFLAEADRIDRLAADAGVELRFVVPPDKVQVYPERLHVEGLAGALGLTSEGLPRCAGTWQAELDVAAAERPWLLPLVGPIVAAKPTTSESLFYRLDSHWSDAGAARGFQVLVDSFVPGLWDPSAVVHLGTKEQVGDLTRLLGKPEAEVAPSDDVQRPGVTVTNSVSGPGAGKGDWDNTINTSRAVTTGPPVIPGRTVIVGDSFLRAGIHLLRPYFEELVFVPWQHIQKTEGNTLAQAAGGPADNLIILQVQRNLALGRFPLYADSIADYLLPAP